MRPTGIVLGLTLLGGAALAQEGEALRATASPAVALEVSSLPKLRTRALRFSAAKTDDLVFQARVLPRVRGSHRLELRLFTPRGLLYQTLSLPFDVRPARGRRLPRPLVLSARLPVSGSFITTSALYGRWRVVPFLDGAPQPCGRELRFEIMP